MVTRFPVLLVGLAWIGQARAEPTAPRESLFDDYCVTCHNDETRIGNFSLESVDAAEPGIHAESLEKVILKLRSGMMPPAGMPRPDPAELADFVRGLETGIDEAAARNPNPGRPILHRLNRTEYRNAIRDLLGLDVDVESLLPPDDMSQGYEFPSVANGLDPNAVAPPPTIKAVVPVTGRLRQNSGPNAVLSPRRYALAPSCSIASAISCAPSATAPTP